MKGNVVFRVIFSVIFLLVFGLYSYKHFSSGWFVEDTVNWGTPEWFAARENKQDLDAMHEDLGAMHEEQPQGEAEPAASTQPEPEETPQPSPESDLPQLDLASWELMLVNTDNLLGSDYEPPELATLYNDCKVDSRIAQALTDFADAAMAEGLPVYLSSGYRAYSEQQYLFNNKVNQVGSKEEAAKIVAVPGSSEHQSGLCCDITDIYRNPKTIDVCENTETFKWLNEHCHEYGFILRFPKDKTEETGIMYEPWHFRYVGVEAATYIKEKGLCLEEFLALYEEPAQQ